MLDPAAHYNFTFVILFVINQIDRPVRRRLISAGCVFDIGLVILENAMCFSFEMVRHLVDKNIRLVDMEKIHYYFAVQNMICSENHFAIEALLTWQPFQIHIFRFVELKMLLGLKKLTIVLRTREYFI